MREPLTVRATRVVVISPNHATEEFLGVVEQMGLTQVSYAFKTLLHTSDKNLAAPYGPVVPISCTVKTDSNDGLFPSTILGKD